MSAKVVWIIGYPNAGKTEVAKALCTLMRNAGRPVVLLDGDEIRRIFSLEATDYDRPGRLRNARRIGLLAQTLSQQGIPVVVAANTLFQEAQAENRERIPGYFEVYLSASEALRRQRDGQKDLYGRFDRGETKSVLGLDLPGDEPTSPHLVLDMDSGITPLAAAETILAASGAAG
ncbi:MAG: adenylyl-sulfate kinase [Fibrobacterota bacterium]|nr:adenylyl-sulfate kinase [Fibrobacterota bacterium]QQS07064.1 MAG: adenylyl-sulfate kinase [Fibrobacterota bacterium]